MFNNEYPEYDDELDYYPNSSSAERWALSRAAFANLPVFVYEGSKLQLIIAILFWASLIGLIVDTLT